MKQKKCILAMPPACFWSVIGACLLGILIGSFFDFDISRSLVNKTDLGMYFATFSPAGAYCLLPAGGACLMAGLRKKGESYRPLGWLLLVFSWFMAVHLSDDYFGEKVRTMLGYTAGESSKWLAVAAWMIWAVIYALVPLILYRFLDDTDPDRLIAVGAAFLVVTFASDAVMQWLKQVGSRPRYKYLLTLDDPRSEFRNWWQMVPYLAGNTDGYLSWPSGHMSIVGTLFALPLLTDCLKRRSAAKNRITFVLVCVFVLLCGYNRIHMTNHFLSDVGFGTLNAYLLTVGVCTLFLRPLSREKQSDEPVETVG
ncbi:MAG: phosphatase PAP2 family protein [Clostridiales bacterium]|nr:phosphatase PAP2 family protein [Clostridiales bacterium]